MSKLWGHSKVFQGIESKLVKRVSQHWGIHPGPCRQESNRVLVQDTSSAIKIGRAGWPLSPSDVATSALRAAQTTHA